MLIVVVVAVVKTTEQESEELPMQIIALSLSWKEF